MLKLVLGRSGFGKTKYVCDFAVKCGFEKLTVVVPEQFSLSAEKKLLDAFDTDALPSDTVTSFSRLALQTVERYSKKEEYIDDLGRRILMKRALKNKSGMLSVYKNDTSRSLIDAFLSVRADMKVSCVSAEDLLLQAETLGKKSTGDKLRDIALVVGEFEALLSPRYADRADDLTKLAKLIREKGLFKDQTVIFDGFHNFSAQEKAVIAAVMTQARTVVVTLPCASVAPNENESDSGVFKNVRNDVSHLIGTANRYNVKYETVLLRENMRAKTDETRAVESSLIGGTARFEGCKDIELYNTFSPADEAELAAQLIRRDVMGGKCRYRDCAVIARSLQKYRVTLADAFKRMHVPFYTDMREDITLRPLFTLVEAALKAAENKRKDENVFRALKTGYFPATTEEIFELENYVLMWGISGDRLFSEYKLSPDGYDGIGEEGAARLQKINATRARVMPPIEQLCRALRGTFDARFACLAVYSFLRKLDIAGQTDAMSEQLRANKDAVRADEEVRVYELLLSALDQIAIAAGDDELTASDMSELFAAACREADMGRIPPVADCVTVGTADRVRLDEPKRVYIIGANEGEFPGAAESGGILTARERELLCQRGIDIGGDPTYWSIEEMFIAYKALSAPSERLTVIYARTDNGTKLQPSQIVYKLKNMFPTLRDEKYEDMDRLSLATTDEAALSLLSCDGGKNDAAVRGYLLQNPKYEPIVRAVDNAFLSADARICDKEAASGLFCKNMSVSATKLDTYYDCKYKYFLRYGLLLKPREKLQMSANNAGTLVHYLLENVIRELSLGDVTAASDEKLSELTSKYGRLYYEKYMGGDEGKTGSFAYIFGRLQSLTLAVLKSFVEEMKQSLYRPSDFELSIGGENGIPPYKVECEDGSISVIGKVDRVDRMEDENGGFVRVVDYKTGGKEFSVGDLLYGMNTQMLIYLFAVEKNDGKYKDCMPGGILYLNAVRSRSSAGITEKPEKIEEKKREIGRMNGLLLDDINSLKGMEHELSGRYIPVKIQKNGGIDSSYTVSQSDMKIINAYIDEKLREMHRSLLSGDIAAKPLKKDKKTTCTYCKYRDICSFDLSDNEPTEVRDMNSQAALDTIKGSLGLIKGGETLG